MICSRDACVARVIPIPPKAWRSCTMPPRSTGSGMSSISWAAAASTPMSLALRAQRPSGSRSFSIEGTTVSQTAVRILRSASPSATTVSSATAGTLPRLCEDEVVAMHGLFGGVRDQLAHLVGAHALDPAQLLGAVVDDPLPDRLAVLRHIHRDLDGV